MLPTGSTIRTDCRNIERDVGFRILNENSTACRWTASTWVNVLLEKHAWISAGLIWVPNASDSGTKGAFEDSKSDALESRSTINLFQPWEDGSRMLRLVIGRNYCFGKSLVVPCVWLHSPKSLSLRDARLNVAHHAGESTTRDRLTHISLESGIHFPHPTVSDPPTYW